MRCRFRGFNLQDINQVKRTHLANREDHLRVRPVCLSELQLRTGFQACIITFHPRRLLDLTFKHADASLSADATVDKEPDSIPAQKIPVPSNSRRSTPQC